MPDTEVRKENGLPERYFMVANQFHPHKNHKVILEALALFKQKGQKCLLHFQAGCLKMRINTYKKPTDYFRST